MGLPPTQTQTVQTLQTPAPIHVAKYCRNGLIPHAVLETELGNSLNFAAAIRGKNLFTWGAPIATLATSNGNRNRWRAAAHTSPLLRRLRAMVYMARNDADPNGTPSVTIAITNADESVTYGSNTLASANNVVGGTPDDTPNEFVAGEIIIGGVPADTDIFIRVEDDNNGRVLAVSIQEEMVKLISGNGYILPPNVSVSTPIYGQRREDMYELATLLHKRQAAQLWNWTVDLQSSPITTNTNTNKNIIDTGVTSVSAASPGATLDTTYCRTRSLATVPCKFYVRAKMSASTDIGEVTLRNAAGAAVATVEVNGTVETWYSTTANLTAADGKLDVTYANPDLNETLSVYAASLFQYA